MQYGAVKRRLDNGISAPSPQKKLKEEVRVTGPSNMVDFLSSIASATVTNEESVNELKTLWTQWSTRSDTMTL